MKVLRIGALISGGGTNLQAIIDACAAGRINGRMVFVGSDNPEAGGLSRADRHGIPTFVVDYRRIISALKRDPGAFPPPLDFDLERSLGRQSLFTRQPDSAKIRFFLSSRAVAEGALLEKMAQHPFDLLVLAGFMRNLTPYFIDHVNCDPDLPRIMNIHPALLPAFPGGDGYGDTFRYGCKVGGCTVHFIDYGEDSGPIISQSSFPIEDGDTLADVKKKGLELEWQLYPECIQLFAEGRLSCVKTESTGPGGLVFRRTIVKRK